MLDARLIRQAVAAALEEDNPWGDLTSCHFVAPGQQAALELRFRQPGLVCGLPLAQEAFAQAAPGCRFTVLVEDGQPVAAGQVAARVEGAAAGLLTAERVALNFVQRLSGVATLAGRYVAAARQANPAARVAATRKTTPGLRALEKYAVMAGGALPHRFCLSDGVLLKDNHLALLQARGLGLAQAIAQAREKLPHTLAIQVEVESGAQAEEAQRAGAGWLLLDNMAPQEMARVAARLKAVAQEMGTAPAGLEASGGITLQNIAQVAASGVDVISIGALTHSAPALDVGLDVAEG